MMTNIIVVLKNQLKPYDFILRVSNSEGLLHTCPRTPLRYGDASQWRTVPESVVGEF